MPTNTYTALATVTLSGSDTSVDFANIPNTYRDLVLVYSVKHSFAGSIGVRDSGLRFNADNGSNYTSVQMNGIGSGSGESSTISSTSLQLLYGMSSADFMPGIIQIMDYSATDKHKTVLYRSGAAYDTNYGTYAMAGRWANNNAIISLSITPSGSYTLLSGSTFSLFGIAS